MREDQVRDQLSRLGEIVGSDEFVGVIERLEEASEEERPEVVREVASVDFFREQGIPTPEGLRVSPRIFESPDSSLNAVEFKPFEGMDPQTTLPQPQAAVCVSIGYIICASYGR